MIQGRDSRIPQKEDILSKVTELQIYKHYFPDLPIGVVTSSPFREDGTPSFIIRVKDSYTYFMDYGTGEKGDVISFVKKIYPELTHDQLLLKVKEDLSSGYVPPVEYCKRNVVIDLLIKRRDFTPGDLTFWERFGVTANTLRLFRVTPISFFWVNGTRFTCTEPAYAYDIGGEYKIYRPTKADYRFIAGGVKIQGIDLLPDTHDILIIQKSYKDVMVCYEYGYPAIAPQSETSPIPEDIMRDLKTRFKRIVILYDNDEAGLKAADELSKKYDLEYIYLDKAKDLSDHVQEFGKEVTKDILEKLLND